MYLKDGNQLICAGQCKISLIKVQTTSLGWCMPGSGPRTYMTTLNTIYIENIQAAKMQNIVIQYTAKEEKSLLRQRHMLK